MSDYGTVARTKILAAVRASAVATAAGVDSAAWASTATPHVFWGVNGYIGQRNRGRLPFVDCEISGTDMDGGTADGGTLLMEIALTVHVGDPDYTTADDLARAILLASLTQIQADHFFRVSTYRVESLQPDPLGQRLTMSILTELSYDDSDFTVI